MSIKLNCEIKGLGKLEKTNKILKELSRTIEK